MEYGKLVLDRYSCRKLTDAPVEQEKIDYIIRCATSAPTAVNYQPVRIWVAKSDEATATSVLGRKAADNVNIGGSVFLCLYNELFY